MITKATPEQILRWDEAATAREVSIYADRSDGEQKLKKNTVKNYIDQKYSGDRLLIPEDERKLFESVVMGCLHSQGKSPKEFAGTFSQTEAIRRMGSSFRPTEHCESDYMFEAVTEPIIVEVGTEPVMRFQLKLDLSNAIHDFHRIRKESAEKEAAYNLFDEEALKGSHGIYVVDAQPT